MQNNNNNNTPNNSNTESFSNDYKLTTSLQCNVDIFKNKILANDDSIVYRYFKNKKIGMQFCIIFVESLTNTREINQNIIKPLIHDPMDKIVKINTFLNYISEKVLTTNSVNRTNSIDLAVKSVLYGDTLLLIENFDEIIYINTKHWEKRSISEPDAEGAIKGPREGFTESINTNVSLLRRKLNTPDLKFKNREIGGVTKTKICLCYLESLVPQEVLDDLNSRLDKLKAEGILGSNYIEESIKDHPNSIFNTIGGTERPDTVMGKLLEGRIALICDGTPYILTIPFIFLEYFQINEDYYSNFIYSSINRLLRMFAFVLSTSTPAIYVALTTFHQELIPTPLIISISSAEKEVPFPTIVEAILMLIVFELLRETGTRLPKNIGQAISIVGALVLGEAAVSASLISAPMVIVVALTAISQFALPKMSQSIVILQMSLLLISSFIGLYGYIFGVIGISIYLFSMKSFGVDYMLKYGSLNKNDLKDVIIRASQENKNKYNRFIIWKK